MGTHKTISDLEELRGTALSTDDLFMVYDQSTPDDGRNWPTKKLQYSGLSSKLSTDIGYGPTIGYLNSLNEYPGSENPAELTSLIYDGNGIYKYNLLGHVPVGDGDTNIANYNVVLYNNNGNIIQSPVNNLPFVTKLPDVIGTNAPNPCVYVSPTGKDADKSKAISALQAYLVDKTDANQRTLQSYPMSTLTAACEVLRYFRANREVTYEILAENGVYTYGSTPNQVLTHIDATGSNRLILRPADSTNSTNKPIFYIEGNDNVAVDGHLLHVTGGTVELRNIILSCQPGAENAVMLLDTRAFANVTLQGCEFYNGYRHVTIADSSMVTVRNCKFENPKVMGIWCEDPGATVVMGAGGSVTTFNNCKTGIRIGGGTLRLTHVDTRQRGLSVIFNGCENGIVLNDGGNLRTRCGSLYAEEPYYALLSIDFGTIEDTSRLTIDGKPITKLNTTTVVGDGGISYITVHDISRKSLNRALSAS